MQAVFQSGQWGHLHVKNLSNYAMGGGYVLWGSDWARTDLSAFSGLSQPFPRKRDKPFQNIVQMLIRGVRVPLFSWYPHIWNFPYAKISAFFFSFQPILPFLPNFTLFVLVFHLWPPTPLVDICLYKSSFKVKFWGKTAPKNLCIVCI